MQVFHLQTKKTSYILAVVGGNTWHMCTGGQNQDTQIGRCTFETMELF